MVTWSLPETDLAHGMTPFEDPFVAAVMWPFILCAWLLTLLVSAFALRHAPLLPSFLLTLGLALATMTIATPFLGFTGTLAAVPVAVGALLYCRKKHREGCLPAFRSSNKALSGVSSEPEHPSAVK